MKTQILTMLFALVLTMGAYAQQDDYQAIEKVIYAFSKAGDQQDAKRMESLLHSEYRVVMNQLFGSSSVAVLPRAAYLSKIKAKEFGGDSREVSIEHLDVNGNNAVARVRQKGSKLTMVSHLQLVKNADGNWQLVADIPTVI